MRKFSLEEKYDINSKFIANGFFEQTRLFLDNLEAPNLKKFSGLLGPTLVCPTGDTVTCAILLFLLRAQLPQIKIFAARPCVYLKQEEVATRSVL